MTRHRNPLHGCAIVAILLAAALPAEAASDPYALFADDGRGSRFLRTAGQAFTSAILGREAHLEAPTPGVKRPAGPRDEPPPPEWPSGPVGVVICVRSGGEFRGCEGDLEPAHRNMSRLATSLGERLARSRSRGRGPVVDEAGLERAELLGWFVIPLDEMGYKELKSVLKAGELDPAGVGFAVPGPEGVVFVAPGEVSGAGGVARIARKGGAAGLFRRPERIVPFRPVPVAGPLELAP